MAAGVFGDSAARRWVPATIALAVISAAVLVVLWTRGVSPFEFSLAAARQRLKPWGANYGPLTAGGEGWRLLAAVFLHANVAQLCVNLWAMWVLGRFLEPLFGSFAFGLSFLLCGFGGNLAALVWDPADVTVGAGPAVFGLIALWPAFALRARGTAPPAPVARLRLALLAFLAYNVVVELLQGGFAPAAWLGGAAAGFAAGLALGFRLSPQRQSVGFIRSAALTLFAAALASAAALTPRIDDLDGPYRQLVAVDEKAVEIYQKAKQNREQGRLDDVALANLIENGILLYWRETSARFAALKHVLPGEEARLAAIREYIHLRRDAWQTLADGLRHGDKDLIDAASRKSARADDAAKAVNAAGAPGN